LTSEREPLPSLPRPGLPWATYRLQFNHRFTFRDAAAITPYLRRLGVTTVYASPYFKARPGSLHGYDVSDHNALNPEIGSEADYEAFVAALGENDLGQLLDVIPNHMGVGEGNVWWMDVLTHGPGSYFARAFDIDWQPVKADLRDRMLLPILGDQYGLVLEKGELTLAYEGGVFFVRYYDFVLPIDPHSATAILELDLDRLDATLGREHADVMELRSIITALRNLPTQRDPDVEKYRERRREAEVVRRRLQRLRDTSPAIHEFLEENVRIFNGQKGDPRSFDRLDNLLERQAYRLADWRVAAEEINYRRFFDQNQLAAIRVEDPVVFEETHRLVGRLLREGKVTGLRVDHLDGLYDPTAYLQRLVKLEQRPAAPPRYLVVEKILLGSERLREEWPIHGTTGYTFANLVNGILVDRRHFRVMDRIYRTYTGRTIAYADEVYDKKRLIMRVSLASELQVLGHRLDRLSERHRRTRDFTLASLTEALREVVAAFPVYRTYVRDFEVHPADRAVIEHAIRIARQRNPTTNVTVYDFVRDTLLLRHLPGTDEGYRQAQLEFVMKLQQFTGPVIAKAVEDTVFYTFNRLMSLNEVGADPERFGLPLEAFHQRNAERAERWAHTMCATATHDTKRGEDVRARITVLSEIPREWQARLSRWRRLNRRRRQPVGERLAPSRNEEYLFYQTLVGAWPLGPLGSQEQATLVERLNAYMLKAVREAKVNTSWINPDAAYERAVQRFVTSVLDPDEGAAFLDDLRDFLGQVGHTGLFAALSQALLKLTCPGVADLYQGTELWDLSLVDPDNRQPVDYERRSALLAELEARCADPQADLRALAAELLAARVDGRVKLYLIWQALRARAHHPALQPGGGYRPLAATGTRADHLCAFARLAGSNHVVVLAPRWFTRLARADGLPLGAEAWEDTEVSLGGLPAPAAYRQLFTGEIVPARTAGGRVAVGLAAALATFPVAILEPV
jgi:(1->4)-alpha-D-glucan 1-alpha-D-glucosylmutase